MSDPFFVDRGEHASKSSGKELTIGNEKMRDNIMSVELAIRRELAYRRRIEMLQMQSQSGRKRDHMISQMPSTSPCTVGIKRKASSGKLQCLPPTQPQPPRNISVNLVCNICHVPCSSVFNLKQHRQGQKHKARVKELEEIQKHGRERARQLQWCNLCGVTCMDECALQSHLIGKKHAARVQAIEDAKEEAESAKIKWEEWDGRLSQENKKGREHSMEEEGLGY